jgi:addiction module HigA family antidote
MAMKNPPHPGLLIKDGCLADLSVTKASAILGVARPTLSNLINGKASVSSEMAIRLAKAFGGEAITWLRLQAAYDLAQAERYADNIVVERYYPVEDFSSRNNTATPNQ